MFFDQRIINKLLDKTTQTPEKKQYYLTIYSNTASKPFDFISRKIKSQTISAIKNSRLFKFKVDEQEIISKIISDLRAIKHFKKGVALFAKVKVLTVGKNKVVFEKNIKTDVVSLYAEPEDESYFGKTFDLDQLININNLSLDGIVISLSHKQADIYVLRGADFKLVSALKNNFIANTDEKYFGTHTPTVTDNTIYGAGFDKFNRSKQKAENYFLNQLKKYLVRLIPTINTSHLLIYHTSSFKDQINQFKHELKAGLSVQFIININKNIREKNQLHQHSLAKIKNIEQKNKRKLINSAKNNYKLITKEWHNVIKAARLNKIDTLFIKNNIKKQGYINNQGQIYLRKNQNTKKVFNLSPWLIRLVTEQSGKIVLIGKNYTPDVWAKLRY